MSADSEPADGPVLETFLELVRIDSPSGAEAAVAAYCERVLVSLGASVARDSSAERTGSDTGNLVASLPGTAPGVRLVFSAHMDCVNPCAGVEPVVRDGVVSSAGETVLGGDDKAGIAAILDCLRRITEDGRPRPDIQVLLTVQEERGLVGAKALDPDLLDGDLCLVLDADGTPGGMVISAPTHYTFTAVFKGRSSHAGVEPEAGISAIAMAARAIAGMQLGKLDDCTTANIGTITGGRATNIVPDEVTVTGECRSRDRVRVEEVKAAMDASMRDAAEAAGGSVEPAWVLEYEGFDTSEDDPNLLLLVRACERAGLKASPFATGGGSDGNIFAADGVPTVVLACGMTNVHSTSETLRVQDLEAMTALLEAIVAEAVSGS